MKKEKGVMNEMIHRLLDGDLSADEKQALMDRMRDDAALREELEGLTKALRIVEGSTRVPAPPFFTAEVMKRLPPVKGPLGRRLGNFFFKSRVLKWNMATALAAAVLAVLVFTETSRLRSGPMGTTAVPKQEQAVTVRMNFYAPRAHRVAIAGTFNKWKVDADVLTKQKDGLWTINIPLKPGVYAYMFIVDDKAWVTDPDAEAYRDDGFGYKNSVLRVGA